MLQLAQLSITTGDCRLGEIDLRVLAGEHVVLTGATGTGKTTLLEAIAGLRSIDSGAILLRSLDCVSLAPAERNLGYCPQDGALFTKMSVRENLAFSLMARRENQVAIDSRIDAVAASLGILSLLERAVTTLSGGEARRVALGRAIAFGPDILLLDEPTTGLDREARDGVYAAIVRLREETTLTILHATHDGSAEQIADRVVRLENGILTEDTTQLRPSIAIDQATAS